MTLTLPIRLDHDSAPDETLHVTASGLPVLIYSINGGGQHPIHGAIFKGGEWHPNSWKANGKHSFLIIHDYDLRDRPKAKWGVWVAWVRADNLTFVAEYDSEAEVRALISDGTIDALALHYLEEGDGLNTPPDQYGHARTCPLGEDCDLTIAWLAGAEKKHHEMQARIEALEAERDRLKQVVRQGRNLISGETVGPEWKHGCNAFLQAARAALKGEGE